MVDDEPREGTLVRAPALLGQRGASNLHRSLLPRHARVLQGWQHVIKDGKSEIQGDPSD